MKYYVVYYIFIFVFSIIHGASWEYFEVNPFQNTLTFSLALFVIIVSSILGQDAFFEKRE